MIKIGILTIFIKIDIIRHCIIPHNTMYLRALFNQEIYLGIKQVMSASDVVLLRPLRVDPNNSVFIYLHELN